MTLRFVRQEELFDRAALLQRLLEAARDLEPHLPKDDSMGYGKAATLTCSMHLREVLNVIADLDEIDAHSDKMEKALRKQREGDGGAAWRELMESVGFPPLFPQKDTPDPEEDDGLVECSCHCGCTERVPEIENPCQSCALGCDPNEHPFR